ncbi:MAG: pyrroline-5-carboxylate reductase dimerization domain-containing protein [Lentisphaerota bacterium]
MKKIGFIGCGHMASSMLETFLNKKVFSSSQVIISETQERVLELKKNPKYAKCSIVTDNRFAAKKSDILFLCVKPLSVTDILAEIENSLDINKHHIISIAACVEIAVMQRFFKGAITRTLPTVTSESGYGTTFATHSKAVSPSSVFEVEAILLSLGDLEIIKEDDYASAVNITSSAPGILAAIFDIYSESAVKNSSIPKAKADKMLLKTILGTVKMLMDNNSSFAELTSKVATKGGITESAVKIIKEKLPSVLDSAVAKTIAKDKELKIMISEKLKSV